MAFEVVMPKWGMSMEEGRIAQWLKSEGDYVEKGEPILEVETEKIDGVVEAPSSGILSRTLFPVGAEVPVSQTIAVITEPGEAVPEIEHTSQPTSATEAQEAQPAAASAPVSRGANVPATPVARIISNYTGLQ